MMPRRLRFIGACPECGQAIALRGGVTVGHKRDRPGYGRVWCGGGLVPVDKRVERFTVPRSDDVR